MTTLLSRRFQLAVLDISYLICGSSSSLLTMQRRSTFLSGGAAYALLYSYKVPRASQLLYMYMHT